MTRKYTGSLSLEWFNKQKSILVQAKDAAHRNGDVPAPKINWINKDEALFYEIVDEDGRGLSPYWVDRSDLRVKEVRPLVFQKAYKAMEKLAASLIDKEYQLLESDEDNLAVENMLIRGDSLLALNSLKKIFENRPDEEKVKCIFIDPPYNTGSAFEQYDDNLAHSEWLTLLRDRLELLKQLLSSEGSIWITIDDAESHYLKVLCDEVFGRANFVANVVWEKVYTPKSNGRGLSADHDHILVYAKSDRWFDSGWNVLPRNEEQQSRFRNPDNDPDGPWRTYPLDVRTEDGAKREKYRYEVTLPSGRVVRPGQGRHWALPKDVFEEQRVQGEIYFGKDGDAMPTRKVHLKNAKEGVIARTWWTYKEVGGNQDSKREVLALFGDSGFITPKPEALLQRILTIATNPGDIVLDSFGGSGTTGAVAHKMGRRWIMIELGEHCNTHIVPRLKKVISGEDPGGITKAVNWQGGGSFKYYALGASVIDRTTRDFNWKLGRDFIEQSLLSSYDFGPDTDFSFPQAELIAASHRPSIGFHRVGQKQMAGVVSLVEPKKEKPISYDELMGWYALLKKFKGTQSITIFTNRGVELAYDSKPEDLEVIKVPHAIFAELGK